MTPNPRRRVRPCAKCHAPEEMYGRQYLCRPCHKLKKKTPESLHKRAAQRAVVYAVRKGVLVRQPCIACTLKGFEHRGISHGHHEDYSKPLDVIWLCAWHHHLTHQRGLEYVMHLRNAA